MKRNYLFAIVLLPLSALAQLGIGLKGGLNFANVSGASSINSSNRSGFHVGVFLAPAGKSIISSRTELEYSRQGYSFKSGANTGNVNLDYILLPQLMGINITKFVQIQLGAQMAFLLNAKADSTNTGGSSGPYSSIMSYYNKFDYSFAAGAEIHPVSGLLIGARYNIGLGKIYKSMESGQMPSFSTEDAKNNVVQIFAGWTFGNNSSKKKK
ncbi:MAG: PorT family protein [Bacteroidetes bacterium]|nr:PorT family protein [Bacteroidota bacterium]MBS1931420.1 PorT family protein [Bacteroidota bacterium]